jgi:GT2 family glycosyltransferase
MADVIVPVYRDSDMTVRCLESVLNHSGAALRSLIVVDDASPDPEMPDALARIARADPRVRVLRNEVNAGFILTCNRGLAERQGDAVLLNSDTLVTPGWLAELADVVHAHPSTACASPLSNSATIFSVPNFGADTSVDRVDASVVRSACAGLPRSTEMPTCHGFCLYLRNEALDAIGALDPIFSPGYNEENDWVMRARALGFVAKRANHAFVYHLGNQSFGGKRLELEERNARILAQRHPRYRPEVARFYDLLDARIAAHAVRVASTGIIRVALDFRHLAPGPDSADAAADADPLSLARALAGVPEVELTLVVSESNPVLGTSGRIVRDDHPLDDVEIIHRPLPVTEPLDIRLLFGSPAHTIITDHNLSTDCACEPGHLRSRADGPVATNALARLAAQATIARSPSGRCMTEIVRDHLDLYRAAIFRPSERSLQVRRELHEVLMAWSAVGHNPPRAWSPGIRTAWDDLSHAVGARVRRELDRFRKPAGKTPVGRRNGRHG